MLQMNLIFLYFFVPCFLPDTRYQVSKIQNTATMEDFLRRETNRRKHTPGIYTSRVPITCTAYFRFSFLASYLVPGMKNIVPRTSDGDWD